jgi:hypothetical protein
MLTLKWGYNGVTMGLQWGQNGVKTGLKRHRHKHSSHDHLPDGVGGACPSAAIPMVSVLPYVVRETDLLRRRVCLSTGREYNRGLVLCIGFYWLLLASIGFYSLLCYGKG